MGFCPRGSIFSNPQRLRNDPDEECELKDELQGMKPVPLQSRILSGAEVTLSVRKRKTPGSLLKDRRARCRSSPPQDCLQIREYGSGVVIYKTISGNTFVLLRCRKGCSFSCSGAYNLRLDRALIKLQSDCLFGARHRIAISQDQEHRRSRPRERYA